MTFQIGCHSNSKKPERSDILTWPSEEQGGFRRCASMNILKSDYIPLPVLLWARQPSAGIAAFVSRVQRCAKHEFELLGYGRFNGKL